MPGPYKDDEKNCEKTPYNTKADFREIDHTFRQRLDRMIPGHLAERIQKIMERHRQSLEDKKSEAS
jgi:hypothetical protein